MPQVVARDLGGERRPGPDDAHLAPEDIPELGQLVEAGPPQEAARPRDPRIVGQLERVTLDLVELLQVGKLLLGVADHRAELDDLELAPVEADPRLAEEHRTAVLRPDGEPDRREDRATARRAPARQRPRR